MYHPRAPLTDPTWFSGRESEIADVFSYLDSKSPQNVSIVGQRRIGKSWLLKKIWLDSDLRAAHLTEPEKYTFIYWDLQNQLQLGPEIFLPRITEQVIGNIPRELSAVCRDAIIPDEPAESLLEILDLLELEEHRVVLLLDEFAAVTSKPAFEEQFFSHLRSVFNRPAMTCITSSFRSLGEMCHLGPDSPFFNIFTRIQLRLFELDAAEEFITRPFYLEGIEVEPSAISTIIRLTGPHPCFISQLNHALAHDNEVRTNSKLTKADVERHSNDFRTQGFDDFTYYLNTLKRMDAAESVNGSPRVDMLHNIRRGNLPVSLENRTYNQLFDLSLVRLSGGRPVLFSLAFSQHLKATRGTDVYFEQAFSNPALDGPNFIRLCEVALDGTGHIPARMRNDLEAAIRNIQSRPQDAMRICGRDVLDPVLNHVYRSVIGGRRDGKQFDACQQFDMLADHRQFPKHLASSFNTIRISGNDSSHLTDYMEACTAGRAFLTVLETIHLADDIFRRFT